MNSFVRKGISPVIGCVDTIKKNVMNPANTRHGPNVGSMLGQRRRRWPNIDSTLGRCLVFAGTVDKFGVHCTTR